MMRNLLLVYFLFLPLMVLAQETEVSFSVTGGFYDSTFSVALSCMEPDCHIRYTTNGNTPTVASPEYRSPLQLGESLYSRSDIYKLRTCPDSLWYEPDWVRHCIVIRAAAFDTKGNRVSGVATQSYFIRSLGCDTHGLPVVSLCADSLDLFDFERGIMVPGVWYDPMNPDWSGNYYQRGREWERHCNVEFYELDNGGINQYAGLRTHGGNARREQQKGLKIYARKEYGEKRFGHKFFDGLDNASFRRLVLKPYRDLAQALRDDVATRMAQSLNVETVASRPTTLFINGEYWGIYYLKERPDEHYLANHFGYKPKDFTVIKKWGTETVLDGSSRFVQMMQSIDKADFSNEDDYNRIASIVDLDCLIDYYCLEIFTANVDWPANNSCCWQVIDEKWRWVFYDGDGCFSDPGFDAFANAVYDGDEVWPASRISTLIFRKLIDNEGFRRQLFERFSHLILNELDVNKAIQYFENAYEIIQDEVGAQVERFGMLEKNKYLNEKENFLFFMRERDWRVAIDLYSFIRWYDKRDKNSGQFVKDTPRSSSFCLVKMALHFWDRRYLRMYWDYERHKMKSLLRSSRVCRWWGRK